MDAQRPTQDTTFVNPEDKFWSLYLTHAQAQDSQRIERWRGDSDGILIFTGLFAATVATFVVAQYPSLSPDSGDETVALLTQVAALLANGTGASTVISTRSTGMDPFEPALADVYVSALWFLSLIASITCALLATLVQQWARQYSQDTQRRGSLSTRGFIHLYLSSGIDKFMMDDAITAVVSLLHLSVLLFFTGLLVFLYDLHGTIAIAMTAALGLVLSLYTLISALPLIFPDSPYRTPMTIPLKTMLFYFSVLLLTVCSIVNHLWISVVRHVKRKPPRSTLFVGPLAVTFREVIETRRETMFPNRITVPKSAVEGTGVQGVKELRKAVKIAWQGVDEAHELVDFCEATMPLISPKHDPGQSDRGRLLRDFLLSDTDILDRIVWLVSHTNPALRKLSEVECNRRLESAVSYSCELHAHLQRSDFRDPGSENEYLSPRLGSVLTQLISVPQRKACHISTFFLVRCFQHRMMLDQEMARSLPFTFLAEDVHAPRSHNSAPYCVDLKPRDLRAFYGTGIQTCDFFDAKDIAILHESLFTHAGRSCALCRLILLVMDITTVHMQEPSHLLGKYKYIWLPIFQQLCREAGIHASDEMLYDGPGPNVATDHAAFYLLAHLFDRVDFRGTVDDMIEMFPHGDDTQLWKVCPSYGEFFFSYPELLQLFHVFVGHFRQSSVCKMSIEAVQAELGYHPLSEPWEKWVEDDTGRTLFHNTVTNQGTYHDPRLDEHVMSGHIRAPGGRVERTSIRDGSLHELPTTQDSSGSQPTQPIIVQQEPITSKPYWQKDGRVFPHSSAMAMEPLGDTNPIWDGEIAPSNGDHEGELRPSEHSIEREDTFSTTVPGVSTPGVTGVFTVGMVVTRSIAEARPAREPTSTASTENSFSPELARGADDAD